RTGRSSLSHPLRRRVSEAVRIVSAVRCQALSLCADAILKGMAHATKADKAAVERQAAIEQTRGMFAHLAPGQSLADDLIADRRAEARAEDREAAEET